MEQSASVETDNELFLAKLIDRQLIFRQLFLSSTLPAMNKTHQNSEIPIPYIVRNLITIRD